jgi:FixJ family two-component response regulator
MRAPALNLRRVMSGTPTIVAFVDDDPGARKAFKRLLSACGYQVLVYESAEQFLECPSGAVACCLVADINLGDGMSGIELGRTLAAQDRRPLPIIFMTGSDNPSLRLEAIELGCVAYLRKPFASDELNDAIRNAGC